MAAPFLPYCQFLIPITSVSIEQLFSISPVTSEKLVNPQIYGIHLENEQDMEIRLGISGTSMMFLGISLLYD